MCCTPKEVIKQLNLAELYCGPLSVTSDNRMPCSAKKVFKLLKPYGHLFSWELNLRKWNRHILGDLKHCSYH